MKKLNRRTILGLAAGLAMATRTKARAEESTTPWEWVLPSEGHLFNLNEDVKIKFTGPENELYSLEVTRFGGGATQTVTGTMIQGQTESTFSGVLIAGDCVAQVRVGMNVYTGPTVLSRSFTIEESSSS